MEWWLRYLGLVDKIQPPESTGLVKVWKEGSDVNRISIFAFLGLLPMGLIVWALAAALGLT